MPYTSQLGYFLGILIIGSETLLGQLSPYLRAKLRSDDWEQRAAAARQLITRHDESAGADTALIGLLARENLVIKDAFRRREDVSSKYGEEYSEYVAKLADSVQLIAERNPQRKGVWAALLDAPYDPESEFADWLAAHGNDVVPILLQSAESKKRNGRGDSLLVLAKILLYEQQQSLRSSKVLAQNQEIRNAIQAGLSDKSAQCRIQAAKAVGLVGDMSDIVALERLVTTDPEILLGEAGTVEHTGFPVRDAARTAIERIRARSVRR